MNKEQLIKLINDLPDDLEVLPSEYFECEKTCTEFKRIDTGKVYSNEYQQNVENTITLKINFKTCFRGEFKRNTDGKHDQFFNVYRIK